MMFPQRQPALPPPPRLPRPARAFFFAALFTVTVAAAMWSFPAAAQDQAVIDKLVQLNKKAMDDYDTADFDTAKKALLEAEKTGKRAGLEGHPVMARTYIHLGALYLMGFKDKPKAQHYFGKALDIQADIRLDKNLTSSSVRDLFASVKAQRGDASASAAEDLFPPSKGSKGSRTAKAADEPPAGGPTDEVATTGGPRRGRQAAPVDPDAEPELPTSITALDCPYPDDTAPGKKVTLRCVAAANLNVVAVALFYKGHQMKDYERVDMTQSAKGWWEATVPKKRVDGKSLQFFFEGSDASDKAVVSNGRAESPNVMLIVDRGTQSASAAVPLGEDENPLEERSRSGPRFALGRYDDSAVGVDTRYGNRRFWVGLGLGTGFVYAINGVPESRVKGTLIPGSNTTDPPNSRFDMTKNIAVTGFGWAGLGHLVPEIGFHFNTNWAISIEGRHQWIMQTKKVAGYTASGAHAGLLKIIRYTKQQRFRGYVAAVGGGGEGVRMTIQTDANLNPQLLDTVRVGGILFGAAGGITFEISKKYSWVAGVNVLYGVPLQGFAIDVNTGLQMNFGDTSGAAEAAAAKRQDSVSTSIDDEEPK